MTDVMKLQVMNSLLVVSLLLYSGCAFAQKQAPALDSLGKTMHSEETAQMLIWQASQTVEVDNLSGIESRIEQLVNEHQGYIENKSLSGEEDAYFKIRVPSKNLISVLNKIGELGNETYRNVSSEDVTDHYIDTEARLKNAYALRDRLKELLDKAVDVKDILQIEKELTRIQSDIDSMEGRLKKLKNQIDYAAINLKIQRKTILGPLGYLFKGIGWFIGKLFVIQ